LPIYGLISDRSAGRYKKLVVISASITGTGSITTGLATADYAFATVQNAETALTSNALVAVTSITGGTVAVVVIAQASAANSVSTVAKTGGVLAVGD